MGAINDIQNMIVLTISAKISSTSTIYNATLGKSFDTLLNKKTFIFILATFE